MESSILKWKRAEFFLLADKYGITDRSQRYCFLPLFYTRDKRLRILIIRIPLMHIAPVARVCHQMLRLRLGRGNG